MGKKDKFSKEKRSEIMSKIRSKDTDIELFFKGFLRKNKIRYLNKKLPGSPDIVLRNYKIVIFCDGDFWHGRKYKTMKPKLDKYWRKKIEKNMERDKRVDRTLKKKGWEIIRLWGSNILKNPERCLKTVQTKIGKS